MPHTVADFLSKKVQYKYSLNITSQRGRYLLVNSAHEKLEAFDNELDLVFLGFGDVAFKVVL